MKKEGFLAKLRKNGYEVETRKLGGGYVNQVDLVTARKGTHMFEYVLKKYNSKEELDSMIRGYDQISRVAKTPPLVYMDKKSGEVAYDLIKGKSIREMIETGDKDTKKALSLLAKELQKLHNSEQHIPKYKRNDSPDENKIRKRAIGLHREKELSRRELESIQKAIREYIPKKKGAVHGDAHLGNFLYSDNQVYIIDPDNFKISDFNADLGKVIYTIEDLGKQGKISTKQSDELKGLFLSEYQGEDPQAIELHKLRIPLIKMSLNNHHAQSLNAVRRTIGLLEAKGLNPKLNAILYII